ncbi:MAG: efflux RND transporter periplasmic adaptor subunit [Syntrophales bacterium]|jgi:membrane fusion protein (multidrug efflux system)|nr:efflux RND transporter periplasmic adaptor subunit [Syntrophales bacterium]
MTKRMIIMLILVTVTFGGIFGYKAFTGYMMEKAMATQGPPPQTVSAIKATTQAWQPRLQAVGTLKALRGADLAPEVSGIVSRIYFQSGEMVQAGALLLEMDAQSDIAKLKSFKATLELARKNYLRDQEQFKEQIVSQAVLDADLADLQRAEAQVSEQQALVDKKAIRAPFDGRLGIRMADLGQYLNPGMKIVTLQTLDPIYVDFFLPQKDINRITVGQQVEVRADAYPEHVFKGIISAIDPKVDTSTRNAAIRATVRNPKQQLLPGMFTTTLIETGKSERFITMPQTAVVYNPYGSVVYLAVEKGKDPEGKPNLVAMQRFVKTGETRGDQISILEGIEEGDLVVTSGQIKLRNGTPILINNKIHPTNDPAPTPIDD